MDKSSLEKFQEIYEGLFKSSNLKEYELRLGEIATVIKDYVAQEDEYRPFALLLTKPDFVWNGACEAYVCVRTHEISSPDGSRRATHMLGSVLVRHNQWDRDKYLNTFPISEYVAGGPIENAEQRVCWFPIYRQQDLRKAIDYMLEMHRDAITANLSAENEGFLS